MDDITPYPTNQPRNVCLVDPLLIPCWARLISLMDVSIALSSLPPGCIAPSESPVALSMVRDWGLVMVWSKAMPLWCWIAAIPHCQV